MEDEPKEPPMFPMEKVLAEMMDLLQYTVKNIDKIPLGSTKADVDAQLEKLQRDISLFEAAMAPTIEGFEQLDLLTQENYQLLKKCEFLKDEMGKKLAALHEKEKEQMEKGDTTSAQPIETSAESMERKQKGLRRIGRSQKWKQL